MLAELINQHALADAQAGNWDAVATILNVPTVEVRNTKSWTMADLITLVQAPGAALIGGTIQAAGVDNSIFAGAWIALNVTGLQLHTDERQEMIDGLAAAGGWPDELKNAVKSAGLTYTSLAGETVTAEQCQTAWAAEQLRLLQVSFQTLSDAVKNAIGTSEQAEKIAEMRSMLDAVEAG